MASLQRTMMLFGRENARPLLAALEDINTLLNRGDGIFSSQYTIISRNKHRGAYYNAPVPRLSFSTAGPGSPRQDDSAANQSTKQEEGKRKLVVDLSKSHKKNEDLMMILYTCAKCDTRSAKAFSKQSYEKGIVIVTCPGCDARHLIADNLGWFSSSSESGGRTIEDIAREKGISFMRRHLALDTSNDESPDHATLEFVDDEQSK